MGKNPFRNLGFLGSFVHTLDSQQRVAIPSAWRHLSPEGAFVLMPGTGSELRLFPPEVFNEYVERANRDPFNTELLDALAWFGMQSRMVICDKQGRITIEKSLLARLGPCPDGIRLIGALTHIKIISAQAKIPDAAESGGAEQLAVLRALRGRDQEERP